MRVQVTTLLLAAVAISSGATNQRSTGLSVFFEPEVLMHQRGGAVNLKIRLTEIGSARVWIADNCAAPASLPQGSASYVVGKSGEYEIPMSVLPGSGSLVCLASTDGLRAQTSSGQPPASPAEGY